jgi:hypothetical protein
MKHLSRLDETVCAILSQYRRIAVVGLSDKSWRDSHQVASYLLEKGYEIIPVNPEIPNVLGLKSYADLASAVPPLEIVNVFRRVEFIPEIVDQSIRLGAKAVWLQYGISDHASADRARQAGLSAIVDRCIMVEHHRHFG